MVGDRLSDALEQIERVRAEALHAINEALTSDDLEQERIRYTGKKSALSEVMQLMPRLQPEERKRLGAEVNRAKQDIERALTERSEQLRRKELEQRLETERVDVTLPGTSWPEGYRHPLMESVRELLEILRQLGFSIYEGPEVEWERYNFDMLNVPKHHPARDSQDTFWVTDDIVLRTQTSPAQIRYMQAHQPPIRIASPGWCYRNEAEDASHGDRFYQIEGLAVDGDITLADLKGTLTEAAQRFFGRDRRVRFRPHYFPFTEPSGEIDIECAICHGTGCRSCGGEGWLELGGCGMVHPKVLQWCGYDPETLSGFAFGIGPDRYTMMKYGITDLRLFREDDLRFLEQFN
jgi:phenylalanyl-tRNA synthetase alpha chain